MPSHARWYLYLYRYDGDRIAPRAAIHPLRDRTLESNPSAFDHSSAEREDCAAVAMEIEVPTRVKVDLIRSFLRFICVEASRRGSARSDPAPSPWTFTGLSARAGSFGFRPSSVDFYTALGKGALEVVQHVVRNRSNHVTMAVGLCKRLASRTSA